MVQGQLISELKEKKIIDGKELIPKNFINDIEITDYNLLFDTYENKVWLNGAIVHDGILQNNANYKFTITGNRFSYRFSLDSDVEKCNILFTNNSHKEDNVFANATVMQFNNVKE